MGRDWPVTPSMFTLNADGRAAAYVVRVAPGNVQTIDSVFTEQGGRIVAKPIDLGPTTDQVYLILYGTGIRNAGLGQVAGKGGPWQRSASAGPSSPHPLRAACAQPQSAVVAGRRRADVSINPFH